MPVKASGKSLFPVLKNEIRTVRSALWFRPTAFSIIAVLIALFVVTIDGFLPKDALGFLPDVETSTVRDLLHLLAGSMLTVTTVTLSVLMLVLSLAAGQASPRAVPEIMADPVTQNALGTFLATFVFALTALLLFGFGSVVGPGVTLTFICALLFMMNSLRYLVQWIHHVADTLKVNRMIDRIHHQASSVLENYLAAEPQEACETAEGTGGEAVALFPVSTGYVQLVDGQRLQTLACEENLTVRLRVQEGDFVHPRRRVMEVRGGELSDETKEALRAAAVVGFERSHEGDPRLGFELLAEVACRALSPGINDPQSALACIEHLGALLAMAAEQPSGDYPPNRSPDGRVHYLRPDFDAFMERALRPIMRDGSGSAEVVFLIMRVLIELTEQAAPEYLERLEDEAQRTEDFGAAGLELEADKAKLRRMAEQLRAIVADRRG